VRDYWAADGEIHRRGEYYIVEGAKGGPPPAHDIGLWIGVYGPRMLRLTGRLGDGWVPSLGGHYLKPDDIPPMQAAIDEAAAAADPPRRTARRSTN
jgi:alkanesulfonate monooxygenase SsuD/methylene tetrahydromethanopterin reductase-like flavin-dependent oxidoreductase (luciferase family)